MEPSDIENIDFEDGKKRVLILGNGTSRLYYKNLPSIWKSEIWGCNWVYKEYINNELPRLDALIGDYVCLKQAVKHEKIMRNVTVYGKAQKSLDLHPSVKYPNVGKYFSDSGTTIVKHALANNYDEIYLLGFDLGGPDIYQYRHHLKNKKNWVENWRKIAKEFTLKKIRFIGYDHKKNILDEMPNDYYAQLYLRGRDHLEGYYEENQVDPYYQETANGQQNIKKSNQVIILGNGKSRLQADVIRFIKTFQGEVWGCNEIYKEIKNLPRLDRVGVQYSSVLHKITRVDHKFSIYSNAVIGGYMETIKVFQDNRNFLTGPHMILQALYERYDKIYLVGFDFGGVDVWDRKMLYSKRLQEEMKTIIQENGISRFHFVKGLPKFLL